MTAGWNLADIWERNADRFPDAVAQVVGMVRAVAPGARVVARSRYHGARGELEAAGAHVIVDEELLTGAQLADAASEAAPTGR